MKKTGLVTVSAGRTTAARTKLGSSAMEFVGAGTIPAAYQ